MKVKVQRLNKETYEVDSEEIYNADYIKVDWDMLTLVNEMGFKEVCLEYPYKAFISK